MKTHLYISQRSFSMTGWSYKSLIVENWRGCWTNKITGWAKTGFCYIGLLNLDEIQWTKKKISGLVILLESNIWCCSQTLVYFWRIWSNVCRRGKGTSHWIIITKPSSRNSDPTQGSWLCLLGIYIRSWLWVKIPKFQSSGLLQETVVTYWKILVKSKK